MKISKFKVVLKYMTGGIAGVIEYILDIFNSMIQTLPKDEVAKYAQLAKDVANFVDNIAEIFIKDTSKKNAAQLTAQAFAELATALLDANLTREELDAIINVAKEAVAAWGEVK